MVDARIWAGALFCTAALVLTGCAADDATSQIRKFLTTDSGPEDVLPTRLEDLTSDPESSRLIGDHAGVSYFVTKYVDPDSGRPGFCLVLSKPPEGAVSGCASDADATRMRVGGSGTSSARVVVANDIIPDGWTKVGDFLIVNPET
ncbi:hypothetical protein [Cryobacterium tagatosivorans]|uniref:Lipoprotein n=1 Tax=Cryobacterium tagatosivorans TaxID=1259199 RepID=A0A4R8UHL5_9MICO|nr:hypothetical protein [Cryobacterium tagatosivorans]TFB54417.1 hypothetical protein E3O23_03665 [Cryobacterium tagatosivorans]